MRWRAGSSTWTRCPTAYRVRTNVPGWARCWPRSLGAPRRSGSGSGASWTSATWGTLVPGERWQDPTHPARARVWARIDGALPDDRRLHQAALAYASDLTLLSVITVPHNVLIGFNVQAASLDHAMWFHRPFRADEWLFFDQVSPSASAGLGLSTARLFQHGTLVANVAQEGLIRRTDPPRRPGLRHREPGRLPASES